MKRLMIAAVAFLALGTVTAHAGTTIPPRTGYRATLLCNNITERRAQNAGLVIYRELPNGHIRLVWQCNHH